MKKIILAVVFSLLCSTAMAGWFDSKEEPELEIVKVPEIKKVVMLKCFYKLGGTGGYGVLMVEQATCSGMRFMAKVSGMEITEYDENMIESNTQTPRDKIVFDKKVKLLWPTLQGIKTSP